MRLKWIYASLVIPIVLLISIAMIPDEGVVSADPVARFNYSPRYPYVGDEIRFDASDSYGGPVSYSWDFGDGHGARGSRVTHTYMDSGYYTVELEVTDGEGNTDTTSDTIYVDDINIDPTPLLAGMGLFLLFYILIILAAIVLYLLNPILGGIFAYKNYNRAKELNRSKEANPYLIGHLVAGLVSLFMFQFVIFSIIAHIVIYVILKNKLKELAQGPPPGASPFPPPPQFNQRPPNR